MRRCCPLYADEYLPRSNDVRTVLSEVADRSAEETAASIETEHHSNHRVIILLVILSAACIGATILICVMVTRNIVRPINEVKEAANTISNGHLNIALSYRSRDELGQLADDIRHTAQVLYSYVTEIQSGLTLKQAKELADRAIQDVKNGIVVAGYALRAIRNEKLWKEHGYASFDVFMEICYQKDKSWASNCIRVYEQFGELAGPEQTPKLKERYQEYSAGGLIEMLSMPEELREQVTADMPVREIRELKREARKVATSELETDPEGEQLEGQLEIYDFPEFMPEPEENLQEEPGWKKQEPAENNVINIMDLVDESAETDCLDEEPAAGRQPEKSLGFRNGSGTAGEHRGRVGRTSLAQNLHCRVEQIWELRLLRSGRSRVLCIL